MFRRRMLALSICAGIATPSLALAGDRPLLSAAHDVAITYRLLGPRPGILHMSIQASTGLARVEGPILHGYGIVDRKAQRMTLVMTEQHIYLEIPAAAAQLRLPELDPSARFTRRGTETIAGRRCTNWDYASDHVTGGACITDDGVMLRVHDSSGQRGIEATEVTYVSRPDADFHPPAGFIQQKLPQISGLALPLPGGVAPR